jgi:hypothetical protein
VAPPMGLLPFPRWVRGPLSVPCWPGTSVYRLKDKTSSRACTHVLPCVLQLQTSPPCQGGLQCCHVPYVFGPRIPAEIGSGAATCAMAPDLTSRLRWAPVLPCVL